MSVDVYMKYKDETVANLGGSFKYREAGDILDFNFDRIHEEMKVDFLPKMKADILAKIAYTPKNYEELQLMVDEMDENMQYYVDKLVLFGRRLALADIASNDDIEFFEK